MSKYNYDVAVVDTNALFPGGAFKFNGFRSSDNMPDLVGVVNEKAYLLNRDEAEVDPTRKQPIPYCSVMDSSGKIYMYRRPGNGNEQRLATKASIGVGGHVEKEDFVPTGNVVTETAIREIREELGIERSDIASIDVVGFINDDRVEVDSVHFGIAIVVTLEPGVQVVPRKSEIVGGKFVSVSDAAIQTDLENWSKIFIDHLFARSL